SFGLRCAYARAGRTVNPTAAAAVVDRNTRRFIMAIPRSLLFRAPGGEVAADADRLHVHRSDDFVCGLEGTAVGDCQRLPLVLGIELPADDLALHFPGDRM